MNIGIEVLHAGVGGRFVFLFVPIIWVLFLFEEKEVQRLLDCQWVDE